MRRGTRLLIISVGGGFGFFLALLAVVFASGQTFGQRCYAKHGDNVDAVEACIYRLSRGERP